MKPLCPQCSAPIELDSPTLATTGESPQRTCPACGHQLPPPAAQEATAVAPGPRRRSPRRALHRNLLILGGAALLTLGALGFFLARNRGGDTHLTESKTTRKIVYNESFRRIAAAGRATEQDLAEITEPRAVDQGFVAATTGKLSWPKAGELARRLNASILPIDALPGRDTPATAAFLAQALPELQGSTLWITHNQAPAILDPPDHAPASDLQCPRRALLFWTDQPSDAPGEAGR